MHTENTFTGRNQTYSSLLREIVGCAKDLASSETALARAEMKQAVRQLGTRLLIGLVSVALIGISLVPLSIFLILGLGNLFSNNFTLSALIVTALYISIGGLLAFSVYRKLMESPVPFSKTKDSLRQDQKVISAKIEDIRGAAAGRRAI